MFDSEFLQLATAQVGIFTTQRTCNKERQNYSQTSKCCPLNSPLAPSHRSLSGDCTAYPEPVECLPEKDTGEGHRGGIPNIPRDTMPAWHTRDIFRIKAVCQKIELGCGVENSEEAQWVSGKFRTFDMETFKTFLVDESFFAPLDFKKTGHNYNIQTQAQCKSPI